MLFRNLVQFESKIPPKNVNAIRLGRILPVPMARLNSHSDLRHVADTHWGINSADVHHAATLHTMQPSVTVQWSGS